MNIREIFALWFFLSFTLLLLIHRAYFSNPNSERGRLPKIQVLTYEEREAEQPTF